MRLFKFLLVFMVYQHVEAIKFWDASLKLLPMRLKHIITTIPASKGCITQVKSLLQGITSEKTWALEMMDATAKLMPGILNGNLQQMGNFDQCLKIGAKVNGSKIEGKYCTAIVYRENASAPLSAATLMGYRGVKMEHFEDRLALLILTWDFCVPTTCSVDDLQLIVNSVTKRFNFKYTLQFSEELCQHKSKQKDLNFVDYIAMLFLFAIFVVIAGSTASDLYGRFKNNNFKTLEDKNVPLIHAFSLYSNVVSLLSTNSKQNVLSCIDGLRVITMLWIVISHHLLIALFMPTFNATNKLEFLRESKNFLIFGSSLAVDTFFVISGLLVSYNFFLAHEKGAKINLTYFYLHRLLRLLPAFAVLILLYASLLRFVGDGPLWILWRLTIYNACRKNWWWNLLFIQNYSKKDRCAHHGWYLSVDTQLYALSPLFLFPFLRNPKRVISVLVGLIVALVLDAFVISWVNKLGVNFVHEGTENILYLPTHIRAPAYLMGSIFGYYIFVSTIKPIRLNKFLVRFLWVTSLCMLLYMPYLYYTIPNSKGTSFVKTSLFNSLSRPVWSLSVCWVIFACATGHGRIINELLSRPFFTVLSKIMYSTYVTHLMVIQITMYQIRGPLDFNNLHVYRNAIGDCIIVCAVAVLWNLCFESPVLVLERILIRKGMQEKAKDKKLVAAQNGKLID